MFCDTLFVHDKINHVQALSMSFAIAAEAICCMCFMVNLQAWRLVVVEWTAQTHVFVWLEMVVVEDLGESELIFDLFDCH